MPGIQCTCTDVHAITYVDGRGVLFCEIRLEELDFDEKIQSHKQECPLLKLRKQYKKGSLSESDAQTESTLLSRLFVGYEASAVESDKSIGLSLHDAITTGNLSEVTKLSHLPN